MGLAQVQAALARLYTDPALVARFAIDPAGVAADLNLTGNDAEHFTTTPPADIHFFAASLVNKRRAEVAEILPITKALVADHFNSLFAAYASSPIPPGTHKHARDAVGFATFVIRTAAANHPRWWRDTITYERDRIAFGLSRQWLFVKLYRSPVKRIAAAIVAGEAAQRSPMLGWSVVWYRGREAV